MAETMRRRVPVQNIRGSDPTLLEVQLQDLLRRPMSQLAMINVLDLIALSETEGRPRSLERSLQLFVDRIAASMADLPAGPPWQDFLAEIDGIEPSRVPHRFREMLSREAQREDRDRDRARVDALLASWAGQEPVPFELGKERARVLRAAPSETQTPTRATRTPTTRSRPAQPARRERLISDEDREKAAWISEVVIERVASAGERGLSEQVLLAGLRHRARDRYPNLSPSEIQAVLKNLRDAGRVRYSAGRWIAQGRW